MKRYPYFIIDGLLIAATALLLCFSVLSGIVFDYALVLVAAAFIAWRYVSEERYAREFSGSVSCIRGLDAWESDFLSLGTLKLRYKGESISYSSEMGQRAEDTVLVAYSLSFTNASKTWFDIRQKAGGQGFEVTGDKDFYALVKGDIEDFDRKYEITRIRQTDGLLKLEIRLGFSTEPLVKEEKSAEMCEFLEDCLEFGLMLNKKLKSGGATQKR